jgi:ABC-type glycerol-3-phosphate transport system permease component
MDKNKKLSNTIWFVLLSLLAVFYVYPVFMILINSFKKERAIGTSTVFKLPTGETFAGFVNYVNALGAKGFARSFGGKTVRVYINRSQDPWTIPAGTVLMQKNLQQRTLLSLGFCIMEEL